MSAPEKNYKDTILLPETGFPMRGDLTKNEPVRLKKWEDTGLYERILSRRMAQGAPRFLLHDGPPFANGDVHMGTALNKILKDLVLKSKTMAGYAAPYIPGWDCHGLPIEFKVVQKARDLDAAEIRRRCAEFAKGFIDIQRTSFRRLGVFGDWENPYLTMKTERCTRAANPSSGPMGPIRRWRKRKSTTRKRSVPPFSCASRFWTIPWA